VLREILHIICTPPGFRCSSFTNALRDALRDLATATPPPRRVVHTARLAAVLIGAGLVPLSVTTAHAFAGPGSLEGVAFPAEDGDKGGVPEPEEPELDEDDFIGMDDPDVRRNRRERQRRLAKRRASQAQHASASERAQQQQRQQQQLAALAARGSAAALSKHAVLFVQVVLGALCLQRPLTGPLEAASRLRPDERLFLGVFFERTVAAEVDKLLRVLRGGSGSAGGGEMAAAPTAAVTRDAEWGHLSASEAAERMRIGVARLGKSLGAHVGDGAGGVAEDALG